MDSLSQPAKFEVKQPHMRVMGSLDFTVVLRLQLEVTLHTQMEASQPQSLLHKIVGPYV